MKQFRKQNKLTFNTIKATARSRFSRMPTLSNFIMLSTIPDRSKKTNSNVPVDRMTRCRSALNNSNGTAKGSINSMIIEYARASYGIMPILLAARPTNVLTRAALTMLPILVFSDLSTQKHIHVIYPLLSCQEKSYPKINTKRERFTTFFTQMQTWPIETVIGEHCFHLSPLVTPLL